MSGKWALSVGLACLWVGGAVAAAQTQEAPPPDTSTVTQETATDETATGEAATPAAPPAMAPPPAAPIDAGTYAVRLRDLEQRINELKEQIFRSKARLSLLAETVLEGVVGGGQAVIVHENRMSEGFKLVRVVYALDGAPILTKADEEGAIGEQKEFEVYNGSIVPGEHTVTVNLEYRGHGYGVFSYLKGYKFKVRSTYTFSVPEGRVATLVIVGYEKGGPTTPLEDRPAVRFIERIERRERPDAEGEGDR